MVARRDFSAVMKRNGKRMIGGGNSDDRERKSVILLLEDDEMHKDEHLRDGKRQKFE